jgi:hypothetical protein
MYHSVFGGGVSVIVLKLWARSLWSQTTSGGVCRRPSGGGTCGGIHSGSAGMPGSSAPKPNGAPADVCRRPGRPGNIPHGLGGEASLVGTAEWAPDAAAAGSQGVRTRKWPTRCPGPHLDKPSPWIVERRPGPSVVLFVFVFLLGPEIGGRWVCWS